MLDISDYHLDHPGGPAVIKFPGQDNTYGFSGPQHTANAKTRMLEFVVGTSFHFICQNGGGRRRIQDDAVFSGSCVIVPMLESDLPNRTSQWSCEVMPLAGLVTSLTQLATTSKHQQNRAGTARCSDWVEPLVLTYEEVAQHKTEGDLWVIVKDRVYDVSDYVDQHPGAFAPCGVVCSCLEAYYLECVGAKTHTHTHTHTHKHLHHAHTHTHTHTHTHQTFTSRARCALVIVGRWL